MVKNLILSGQKTLISGEANVLGKVDINSSNSILLAVKVSSLMAA